MKYQFIFQADITFLPEDSSRVMILDTVYPVVEKEVEKLTSEVIEKMKGATLLETEHKKRSWETKERRHGLLGVSNIKLVSVILLPN